MPDLKNEEYEFSEFMRERRFVIPEYQRYYAWSESHFEDLWTDLENLIKTDRQENASHKHYMGTIICKGGKSISHALGEINQYEVVDGQQRLTTLTILFKCLINEMEERDTEFSNIDDSKERYIRDERITDDVRPQKLRLQKEGVKDNKVFRRILKGEKKPDTETPSQEWLVEAKDYFKERISIKDDQFLRDLRQKIGSLQFMVYKVDSEEKATLIFESINDRGKGLTNLEKTKSFLMHKTYLSTPKEENVEGKIQDIRADFSDMYKYLQEIKKSNLTGNLDEDAFQRNHFVSYMEKPVFKEYLEENDEYSTTRKTAGSRYLEILKWYFDGLQERDREQCWNEIRTYSEDLANFFRDYRNLVKEAENDNAELKKVFLLGKKSNFIPLLVRGYQAGNGKEWERLLQLLEVAIFRIYTIGNKRSNTGRNRFYNLSYDLMSGEKDMEDVNEEIKTRIEKYEPDDSFKEDLNSDTFYKDLNASEIRYLFFFYDKYLKLEESSSDVHNELRNVVNNSDDYSIDHIWPQNPDKLGFSKDEDTKEAQNWRKNRHRLGNLTLTTRPRNSTWHDNVYSDKKADYDNSDFRITRNVVSKYAQNEKWSINNINRRTKDITKFALKRWSIDESERRKMLISDSISI